MENLSDVQTFVKCKCGCGRNLPIGREDKEFLNRAHKQRAKRYRDGVYRYPAEIGKRLVSMQKYLDDHDVRPDAIIQLTGIRDEINRMIGANEATKKVSKPRAKAK